MVGIFNLPKSFPAGNHFPIAYQIRSVAIVASSAVVKTAVKLRVPDAAKYSRAIKAASPKMIILAKYRRYSGIKYLVFVAEVCASASDYNTLNFTFATLFLAQLASAPIRLML